MSGREARRARPRTRAWAVAAVLVAGAALGLAACGIPIDTSPHALAPSAVPFGLLQPSSQATTTTTQPSPVAVSVPIFLVNGGGRLVSVARDVAVPAPLTSVLDALVAGPTASEATAGLSSAVPPQTTVLSAAVSGGIATVNLAGPFTQLVGPPQIEAVAQFVFTATAQPGVHGVAFELGGQAVEVPVANGADVPVATPDQFAPLAPVPAP
ncbi:MAG TPA: GerMN domain-containing protein [Acidimicrobiales bacterium]|nr:GerMN domain-containing protein [Acidimicrobiales bacterium]